MNLLDILYAFIVIVLICILIFSTGLLFAITVPFLESRLIIFAILSSIALLVLPDKSDIKNYIENNYTIGKEEEMKVKLLDKRLTPDMLDYKTEGSAGIDLYILPNTTKDVITSNGYHIFRSGIAIEIPEGFVGIILPRSSSSALGIALANTAGVIDSDFRGEILLKIFKWNKDAEDIEVKAPMRIAQLLIMPVIQVELDFVDELSKTERGVNGWGSTGIN